VGRGRAGGGYTFRRFRGRGETRAGEEGTTRCDGGVAAGWAGGIATVPC
jgi:hypothetical protein